MSAAQTTGYAVYTRHGSEPALRQVGEVQATSVEDAVVFAYTLYDERRWVDMCIVPKSAVHTLISPA